MVAVFLIPVAIMIVACLLERFESRAMSVAPPPRRSRADLRQPALPAPSEWPAEPGRPARRLSLVPAPTAAVDLDPDTLTLRRAS